MDSAKLPATPTQVTPPAAVAQAVEVPAPPALSPWEGGLLVSLALEALGDHFRGEGPVRGQPSPGPWRCPSPGPLTEPAGAFVSVHVDGELRGCLGVVHSPAPLWSLVQEMAVAAATRDPRFPPVGEGELLRLSLEVSVLGKLAALPTSTPDLVVSSIKLGEHGLSLRHQRRGGLLLPQVPIRHGWDAERFLAEICRKAGLQGDAWRESGAEVSAFRCAIFHGQVGAKA